MDLKARMQDGRIVTLVRVGSPQSSHSHPRSTKFAIHNGEILVWHPEDKDGTLFLTALTRKEVQLITGPQDRAKPG
jgi:hypothetical protein